MCSFHISAIAKLLSFGCAQGKLRAHHGDERKHELLHVRRAIQTSSGYHLGSASLTTNVSGQKVSELRYLPFGETRWAWGVTPTDRRLALSAVEGYTGQRELPAIGLFGLP